MRFLAHSKRKFYNASAGPDSTVFILRRWTVQYGPHSQFLPCDATFCYGLLRRGSHGRKRQILWKFCFLLPPDKLTSLDICANTIAFLQHHFRRERDCFTSNVFLHVCTKIGTSELFEILETSFCYICMAFAVNELHPSSCC